jgi:hypothetical protein
VVTALCEDLSRAVVLVAIHSHHMWVVPTPSVQMVLRLMQLLRLLVATQLEKEQHMHLQ